MGSLNTDPKQTILRTANASYGPPVEEVHYYFDQLPIGLAVASDGRIFACYTRGTYAYTLGVIVNQTAEAPFPTAVTNLEPDKLNTAIAGIPFSVPSSDFISVQALTITSQTSQRPETLWVLDTGRPTIQSANGQYSMPYAQPGGPKLVAINITAHNDTVYRSYSFPADVHYPDSYMNDVRLDLRANLSYTAGEGVAYIMDSSDEGRPGFIVLDLGSGDAHRRLTQDPSVLRVADNVPSYLGRPFYDRAPGQPIGTLREGLDGMQISADGARIYYSPLTSTELYSIPATNLRIPPSDALAELAAHGNISSHGQRGADANGFEGDTHNRIYQLMPTENAIDYYDPNDLQTHAFVKDPRIIWPDSASVAEDGHLYVNINQLFLQPQWNDSRDTRWKPGAILRVKLPERASKQRIA